MSLNTDATILVTVQSSLISNIWTAAGGIDRAVQVRAGSNNSEGVGGLALAPDGRVLFYSRASGGDDIWIMNPDGSAAKQLTSEGRSSQPAVTPDGQYVVYVSVRDFKANLWRMRLDGSEKTQLTNGDGDYFPDVSPDSRWVVYISETLGESSLLKMPIEGGQPVRLSENLVRAPQVSPDGKWIVCAWRKDENSTWRYAILPFEGGEPTRVFDLIGRKGVFRWAADSKSLYYLRDTQGGVTNIWNLPLEKGEARQVTEYNAESILDFAWSADRKSFAMSKGLFTNDVVLLKGL
jgi:tricorn protease